MVCSTPESILTPGILMQIQSLLGEPNNESPLNTYAAKLWANQEEYRAVLHRKNGSAAS